MQRDCWGRGGHTLQPTNTVLHLPCSVNVRPVTIAQSSSHLDAWAHPARLINVGPATWTLCVQPDWRFSLTVLVVTFSSSGCFFLVLCPITIDGFGRRRSTYDGGSSGRGRRKYMISFESEVRGEKESMLGVFILYIRPHRIRSLCNAKRLGRTGMTDTAPPTLTQVSFHLLDASAHNALPSWPGQHTRDV